MKKNIQNLQLTNESNSIELNSNISFQTAEGIDLKPIYTEKDIENLEHIGFAAGFPPYLRGPYSTMFVQKPWTIRQYAGFLMC